MSYWNFGFEFSYLQGYLLINCICLINQKIDIGQIKPMPNQETWTSELRFGHLLKAFWIFMFDNSMFKSSRRESFYSKELQKLAPVLLQKNKLISSSFEITPLLWKFKRKIVKKKNRRKISRVSLILDIKVAEITTKINILSYTKESPSRII